MSKYILLLITATSLLISVTNQAGFYCLFKDEKNQCYFYFTKEFDIAEATNFELTLKEGKNFFFVFDDLTNGGTLQLRVVNLDELVDKIDHKGKGKDIGDCPYCKENGNDCWSQGGISSENMGNLGFGLVICKLVHFESSDSLGKKCPKSKIEILAASTPGIDEGTLFVPYIDKCINFQNEETANFPKTMIKTSSSSLPIRHHLCKSGSWVFNFNDVYVGDIHYAKSVKTVKNGEEETVKVSVANLYSPAFLRSMKCAELPVGNRMVLVSSASSNGWTFSKQSDPDQGTWVEESDLKTFNAETKKLNGVQLII